MRTDVHHPLLLLPEVAGEGVVTPELVGGVDGAVVEATLTLPPLLVRLQHLV